MGCPVFPSVAQLALGSCLCKGCPCQGLVCAHGEGEPRVRVRSVVSGC